MDYDKYRLIVNDELMVEDGNDQGGVLLNEASGEVHILNRTSYLFLKMVINSEQSINSIIKEYIALFNEKTDKDAVRSDVLELIQLLHDKKIVYYDEIHENE